MSTYTQTLYQVVFSSKYRKAFLTTKNKEDLFNYIAGIALNKKCIPHIIGGYGNHLHLIISLHPSESLSGFVRDIKKATLEWMVERKNAYISFQGWQIGYGAFTYDLSAKRNLINYVKNQEEHHRKVSFEKELVGLLEESGISYDLKYLFV